MPGPIPNSERTFFSRPQRRRTKRIKHAAVAALIGTAAAALAAQAQPPATGPANAAAANGEQLQEVTITGSRIPVPANISAASPIVAIGSQDIAVQGRTDISDVVNQLPQIIISYGADLGNNQNALTAAGGVATADLRGLGPQRTLVLVDGKRLYIGDPNSENPNPAADLDQIPTAMIERVDVVTGGASAVYGSDAVAGVINFITRKNFQGVQIDASYGFYNHDNSLTTIQELGAATQATVGPTNPPFTAPSGSIRDGFHRDASVIMGTNIADNAGNITGYITWHHQDPITNADRDFAHCQLVSNSDGTFSCIGTSNSNWFGPQTNTLPNGTVITPPGYGNVYNVVGNKFLPFGQVGAVPPWEYNPNPFIYMQRQDDRWNAGVNANVEVNDHLKPYLIATFMDDRSTEIVGPSAAFKNSYPYSADNYYRVNCSNPLLSAQEASLLCTPAQIAADKLSPGTDPANIAVFNLGRRNIEGGGRVAYFEHINYRVAAGATGDIIPGFTYDAYGQYFYTSLFNANTNYLNYANMGQALIATGTAANATCLNPTGGCVPWNIFNQGGVTAAQLAYLQTPGTGYGTDSETIMHVDVTGSLDQYGIVSPLAHEGVGINIGGEHRGDTYDFDPDAVEQSGALSGFSGAVVPIHAANTINEGFIEVRTPMIQGRSFVQDLVLDLGYRYSNYSTAGQTNTWKAELQWQPTPDFRLRYSYDRAVRAPNLFELFSPQSYGQTTIVGTDPCAGAAPALDLATCERTHVTPALYGKIPQCTAAQCGQVIGGNPDLLPEEADTYSIGVTFTPTELPGLSGSVDYWHIAQFGLIAPIPADVILNQCIATAAPIDCSQIVRNPVTGALTGATVAGGGYILQTSINSGTGLTSGIDAQFSYRHTLGSFGTLTTFLNGSYLEHSITTPYPGAISYDCAGLFGASCNVNSVNPNWRHILRVNWETPWARLLISATWRFIGAVHFDNNSNNPFLHFAEEGVYDYTQPRIPSYSYFDFSVSWPVWRDVEIRGGLNNAFDKNPPVIGSEVTGTGSPNSYPTYDILGREVFFSFTAKF